MQQRARAGHAAHAFHRTAAEVAGPHGDGESRRGRDRPVVGEVAARAGLGGDREGEIERRLEPKPGIRATGSVRMSSTSAAARRMTRIAVRDFRCHAVPCQSHSRSRSPDAAVRQRRDSRWPARAASHRRCPARARARSTRRFEPATSKPAWCSPCSRLADTDPVAPAPPRARCTSWRAPRGRAPGRESGDRSCADDRARSRSDRSWAMSGRTVAGGVAAIEAERIQKRLERRARLARRDDHVHLSGGVGPEVGRADPGQDLAAVVVEHDGRCLLARPDRAAASTVCRTSASSSACSSRSSDVRQVPADRTLVSLGPLRARGW